MRVKPAFRAWETQKMVIPLLDVGLWRGLKETLKLENLSIVHTLSFPNLWPVLHRGVYLEPSLRNNLHFKLNFIYLR